MVEPFSHRSQLANIINDYTILIHYIYITQLLLVRFILSGVYLKQHNSEPQENTSQTNYSPNGVTKGLRTL